MKTTSINYIWSQIQCMLNVMDPRVTEFQNLGSGGQNLGSCEQFRLMDRFGSIGEVFSKYKSSHVFGRYIPTCCKLPTPCLRLKVEQDNALMNGLMLKLVLANITEGISSKYHQVASKMIHLCVAAATFMTPVDAIILIVKVASR